MFADKKLMAFCCTGDPDRARPFYRDTLGLKLIEEHQFALVFDANGTELRVAISPGFTPARHTVLGWQVPDIAGAMRELETAGVVFNRYPRMQQDDSGVWTAPGGAKVAWFQDPDGNVLSVTEFPLV